MRRDEMLAQFRAWAAGPTDEEIAHGRADEMLLEYIGDPEITEAFNNIPKWYA
jgi:hypothetical protein